MTQNEQKSALKPKTPDSEAYTKTLLYDGVRQGKVSKKHLEAFSKNLNTLLERQIKQYTNDGSSVKTEITKNLTSSIFYCIDTTLSKSENTSLALEKLQSTELPKLFKEGIANLNQELNQAKLLYSRVKSNKLNCSVYAYNATIDSGIPLFFKEYSPEFSAPETPGSIDYFPVYYHRNFVGVHYIKEIINNLYLENHFCKQFDLVEIQMLLEIFSQSVGYATKDFTENIFGLVLNNAIVRTLLKSDPVSLLLTKEETLQIAQQFEGQPRKVCKQAVQTAVEELIVNKGLRWPSMKTYLEKCQDKTVAGLYRSVKQGTLCSFLAVR